MATSGPVVVRHRDLRMGELDMPEISLLLRQVVMEIVDHRRQGLQSVALLEIGTDSNPHS